jgi:hypothetical protein
MRHSTFILSLLICFAGAVSAADDVLRIMLEEPVAGEIHGGVGNLRGWAVATAGIDKIEIMIDGEYAFDAPYGGARGDVGGAFPGVANASQSGFSLAYAYSNLSPGSHTITAVAHTLDGETQMSSATFETVRFKQSFISGANAVDLAATSCTVAGDEISAGNALIGGDIYDILLDWRTAEQGFEIIKIVDGSSADDNGTGGSGDDVIFSDSDLSFSFASNLDDAVFFIGDTITWTVTITNRSAADAPAFLLQESGNDPSFDRFGKYAEWLEIPSICTVADGSNGYPYDNGLVCDIDTVRAKSTQSLVFVTKMRADALSIIPSGGIPNPWFDITTPVEGNYVVLDNSFKAHNPIEDVLTDSDGDGVSDFNEGLVGTNPNDRSSLSTRDSVIDVAFLYTRSFTADISRLNQPQPYIDDLVGGVNNIYGDISETGIQFRAVHYQELLYENPDATLSWNSVTALMEQYGTPGKNKWAISENIRVMSGADLVVILDGQAGEDEFSGLATGTFGSKGYFANNSRRTVVMHTTNFNEEESTLAHELGHVFGLAHGARQTGEGIFGWARGFGVDNEFATIMAYSGLYNVTPYTDLSKRFSNPRSMACQGLACGVDKADVENGADAVSALQATRYQVEAFAPTRPTLEVTFSDATQRNVTIAAGAVKNNTVGFDDSFSCEDAVTVASTIRLAEEHVGLMGSAHAMISAGALGVFAVNAQGELEKMADTAVTADNVEALFAEASQGRAAPLRAAEMPIALDALKPKGGLFESAALAIHFGYTLADNDLVVMSKNPLSVEFNCL